MLVLSRKVGEEICIDGVIKVTVLGISGSRIRLGIEAPKHLPVVRSELQTIFDTASGMLSHELPVPENRLVTGGYLKGCK